MIHTQPQSRSHQLKRPKAKNLAMIRRVPMGRGRAKKTELAGIQIRCGYNQFAVGFKQRGEAAYRLDRI